MDPIKVLIIDQNILVRRALAGILSKSNSFIPKWDSGGMQHVKHYITENEPDVVLLNIEKQESPGMNILRMIRDIFPKLPVAVISSRTREGAEASLAALKLGIVDVLTIPKHRNTILFAENHLKKRLFSIIRVAKNLYERRDLSDEILNSLIHPQRSFEHFNQQNNDEIMPGLVVIGSCLGGPKDLFTLVKNLPASLPAPVLVVQHFPKIYTRVLAEKLDEESEINVREVVDGAELKAGTVWIAQGGYHCEVEMKEQRPVLNVHHGVREHNSRPSIDALFRSAVNIYSNNILGVLLSGAMMDGVAGSEKIIKAGGQIIVQDPETAIAPELPLSIIRQGLTKEYYSPQKLSEKIVDKLGKKGESVSGKEFMG